MKSTWLVILFIAFNARALAAEDSLPANNNKAITIWSKQLQENRSVWVHLPDGYNETQDTYPVLYVLDGDNHFTEASAVADYLAGYDRNRVPKLIVVSILNVDRTRDFTPIHSLEFGGKIDSARMSTTGGGDKFLQFLQKEVAPLIDSSFRTQPYRILAAHSLGGLFGLYALETDTSLFKAVILMSPAFYGGNNKIFTNFTPFLKSHPALKAKLFISIGDEDTHKVDSLQQQLANAAPKTVTWAYQQYKNENHFSVTFKSLYDGLRFIYKDWFIDYYSSTPMWYKDLQRHFDTLSATFGYTILATEEMVNNCGYTQLRAGHVDCAIDMFKENTKKFPQSWNAFDSLGEAYAAKGKKDEAIASYKKSVELNPNNEEGVEILKKLRKK